MFSSKKEEKKNRGVVYRGPQKVVVEDIPYPDLEKGNPEQKKPCPHGIVVQLIASNICGSDQHMVRGRTMATPGIILGHEITGKVVEVGRDVEFLKVGDLVSVPFNVACGRCKNCIAQKTNVCLNVNKQPGGAYGYVNMGGWAGGQAEYVLVPYADFQCLKLPPEDEAMPKIKDLALLTDILPTGFHGAVTAGVGVGSTVYVAGAGPVGLACAASCQLLGAAAVIVGDVNVDRLSLAKGFGCETIDLSKTDKLPDAIDKILGEKTVDCAVDCVGYEALGCGHKHDVDQPNCVLNQMMDVTAAGGGVGVPGLYINGDPQGVDKEAKKGILSLKFADGWMKSLSIVTGQCPVMRYNRKLMNAIMWDRIDIARAVNVQMISLDEAPDAYKDFDEGAAKKFIIDPHNIVRTWDEKHKK